MKVFQKVNYRNTIQNKELKELIEDVLLSNPIGQNLINKKDLSDQDIKQYLLWNNQRKTDWNIRMSSINKITLTDNKNQNKIIFNSFINQNYIQDFSRIQQHLMYLTKNIDCLIVDQQTIFDEKDEEQYLEDYEDYFLDIKQDLPIMKLVDYFTKKEFKDMSYMFVDRNQTQIKDGKFQKLFNKQPVGFDFYLNIFGLILQRNLLKNSGKIMLSDYCSQEYIQIYFNEFKLHELEQINQGYIAYNFFTYINYMSDVYDKGCFSCSDNLKKIELQIDLMMSLFTNKIDKLRGELIAKQIFNTLSEQQNKLVYTVLPLRIIPFILQKFQKLSIEQKIVGTNYYKFDRNKFIINKYEGDLRNLFIDDEEFSKQRALSYNFIGQESPDEQAIKYQQNYNRDFRQIFDNPGYIFLKQKNDTDCGGIQMITNGRQIDDSEEPDIDYSLLERKEVKKQEQKKDNKNFEQVKLQNETSQKIKPKFKFKKKKKKQ